MATGKEVLERLVPRNDAAPHRTVIWVSAETYELTPHGECSGMTKHTIKRFPVYVDGADKHIAVRKANEVLEALKEQCQR